MKTTAISIRPTNVVSVGELKLGGGYPVVVQSMTDTPTSDIVATAAQIEELVRTGSEIVYVSGLTDDMILLTVGQAFVSDGDSVTYSLAPTS